MSVEPSHDPPDLLTRVGAVATKLAKTHLWGKRRVERPALTGDEAVWSRIESERCTANTHVAVGAYLGFGAGLTAGAVAAMVMIGPDMLPESLLRHGSEIVWVIVLWLLPVSPWLLICLPGPHQRIFRRLAPAPRWTAGEVRQRCRIIWWFLAILLAMCGVAFVAMLVAGNMPTLTVVGLAASGALIFAGLGWRSGRDPACRRCWYPVEGTPDHWTRCNECGAELNTPLAVVRGQKVRWVWMLILGLAGWVTCVWAIAEMLAP